MEPVTKNIPALALRGLAVFPRMNASFDLERLISMRALERAMETDQELFVVTQREVITEDTLKTLHIDYCDIKTGWRGVWLPAVEKSENAWREAVELQVMGFDAWNVQPFAWSGLGGDEDSFMTTAGLFNSESEAREAVEQLKDAGLSDLFVKQEGDYIDQ